MLEWLSANLGTILVALAVLTAVTAAVIAMRKNKKQGRSSCGCSCGSCPMGGSCHSCAKR